MSQQESLSDRIHKAIIFGFFVWLVGFLPYFAVAIPWRVFCASRLAASQRQRWIGQLRPAHYVMGPLLTGPLTPLAWMTMTDPSWVTCGFHSPVLKIIASLIWITLSLTLVYAVFACLMREGSDAQHHGPGVSASEQGLTWGSAGGIFLLCVVTFSIWNGQLHDQKQHDRLGSLNSDIFFSKDVIQKQEQQIVIVRRKYEKGQLSREQYLTELYGSYWADMYPACESWTMEEWLDYDRRWEDMGYQSEFLPEAQAKPTKGVYHSLALLRHQLIMASNHKQEMTPLAERWRQEEALPPGPR